MAVPTGYGTYKQEMSQEDVAIKGHSTICGDAHESENGSNSDDDSDGNNNGEIPVHLNTSSLSCGDCRLQQVGLPSTNATVRALFGSESGALFGESGDVNKQQLANKIRLFLAQVSPQLDLNGRCGQLPTWLANHGYGDFMKEQMAACIKLKPPDAKVMKVAV